ncbi:LysM peptidoglycan-binding domain-containing M23 family metallopeptidase [Leptospira idonii]|uniref:M23 family metallopeptidase n=1 Tax=Leptospira idonii TaxID=1193500 RepID=A0A4R9LW68_9LEPT|nr:M23 family metallopeptidase [Leptospira idonii]TGN17059.1 M23 family metallopeptidase [Leptospira idonii]
MKFCRLAIVLFCHIFLFHETLFSEPALVLANLDYQNPILKNLRSEVKENLRISKSGQRYDQLIPLKYYRYKVKKEDNFFKIMARTGMDLETLSSVNELSSPHDLAPGMILEIPNMRGTFHPEGTPNSESSKMELSKKYSIPEEKLQYDESRGKWFVPGVMMGKVEKSFFYGSGFFMPLVEARLTSGFGKRNDPFTKKETFHGGVDLAAKQGSDVLASQDGTVEFLGVNGGYGKLIILKHSLGYETRYGHLSAYEVKHGDTVKKGQKIGEVGMTGRATGPHLHFEIRRNSKRQKPFFSSH